MTELDETLLRSDPAHRPTPVGWRILVEPIPIKEQTKGGILLPDQVKEANQHLNYVGYVVDMGPLCYRHAKFEGGEPWCQVGDLVAFGQYDGQTQMVRAKGGDAFVKMRMVNDDAILGKLQSVESVLIYA